jgi:hypothetical protein
LIFGNGLDKGEESAKLDVVEQDVEAFGHVMKAAKKIASVFVVGEVLDAGKAAVFALVYSDFFANFAPFCGCCKPA